MVQYVEGIILRFAALESFRLSSFRWDINRTDQPQFIVPGSGLSSANRPMMNQKRATSAYAEDDGLSIVATQAPELAKSETEAKAPKTFQRNRIHELDGLRAIAILLVM